ncbi:MAG: general secretion pathway protein GspK [Phycisphaerales bacterium]
MRVRRRAFALIIVLVATAAVFALGMRSAAASRAAQIEARVVSERVRGERLARSAVVLVLRGLTTTPTQGNRASDADRADAGGGGGGGGAGGLGLPDAPAAVADAGGEEEDKTPDLPAIIREMIGEQAEEIEEKQQQAAAGGRRLADGGGLTGRRTRATQGLDLLKAIGLPGAPVEVRVEDRVFRVTLTDAGGLLNVNSIDEERFTRYLTLKGTDARTARRVAQQLMDWRDADTSSRTEGAEAAEYQRRGIVPRDADLFALEEMLYLPAMTRELFELIRPDLCAGGDGRAHLGSAPAAVLLSIDGMTPSAVEEVLSLRRSGKLTPEAAAGAMRGVWDRALEKVRVEPSGFVRIEVETLGRVNAERVVERVGEARKFEGIAVVSDQGVTEIGLRAM